MWGEGDLVLQVGLDWGLLMGLIVCVCGVIKCGGMGDLVLQVGLDWGLLMGLSCVCVWSD